MVSKGAPANRGTGQGTTNEVRNMRGTLMSKRIGNLLTGMAILIGLWAPFSALAQTDTLTVLTVRRISHPAYNVGNIWYSVRDPWNRNFTRILLYETPGVVHPDYGKEGRGMVWGFLDDLKNWHSLDEYEQAARPILPGWSWSEFPGTSIYWSPFPGEENILYLLHRPSRTVWRLDVDTGNHTVVASYDPGNGTDVSNARALGWTLDGRFVVNFDNESKTSGGYTIDVQTGRRTLYSSIPSPGSAEGMKWPTVTHGHTHKSPDGSMIAKDYGHVQNNGVRILTKGVFVEDMTFEDRINPPWPYSTCYVSWRATNDWFLVSSDQYTVGQVPTYLDRPTVVEYVMWQVFFDGSHFAYHELLRVKTAGRWDPDTNHSNGNEVRNYHAHLIPVLRKDGKEIFFTATEGKYSYEDYRKYGATPWGFVGAFIAELSTSSPEPPPPRTPNVPTPIAFVLPDGTTLLAWKKPGSEIVSYNIYRNSQLFASTPDTFFLVQAGGWNSQDTFQVTGLSLDGIESSLSQPVMVAPLHREPSYVIPRAKGLPTVDGQLIEYAGIQPMILPLHDSGDTARVRLLWSPDGLWIAYTVRDSEIRTQVSTEDGPVWRDDSVEWFVGVGEVYLSASAPTGKMYILDRHGIVNAAGVKYDASGTLSGTPSGAWDGEWQTAVRIRTSELQPGYDVEIAIPWSSLGLTSPPREGQFLRLGIAVNDADGSSLYPILWPDIQTDFEERTNWAVVELGPEPEEPVIVDTEPPQPPSHVRVVTPAAP